MDAATDENGIGTMVAVTPLGGIGRVFVNPSTGAIKVNMATTGIGSGKTHSLHDSNTRRSLTGVSSTDYVTPTCAMVSINGELLIKRV